MSSVANKMKKLGNISIIGVGLIGGSLGMALRKKKAASGVTGVGRNRARLRKAVRLGAVDSCTTDLRAGVRDADIIVIAAPVGVIQGIVSRILPFLKKGCVITDTGSTKKALVADKIKPRFPNGIGFVGGHPLAGSQLGGVANARSNLFIGTVCVLTPVPGTDRKALAAVKRMWESAGASVELLSPAKHDEVLGLTSHLPHLVAVALVRSALGAEGAQRFIAGGFRDTTRVASSSGGMWRDIFVSNRAGVLKALKKFRSEILRIEGLIKSGNGASLARILDSAKRSRDAVFKT